MTCSTDTIFTLSVCVLNKLQYTRPPLAEESSNMILVSIDFLSESSVYRDALDIVGTTAELVGLKVGSIVGSAVGMKVDGVVVGNTVGVCVGTTDGARVGRPGRGVGRDVGVVVGIEGV